MQSPFLHRIGGSPRVRTDLSAALGEGRGVTAKIRWLSRADEEGEGEGRPRWIHCTPLLGHSGAVGVWMIVLVDDEATSGSGQQGSGRRFRTAPPVASNIGGKEWGSSHAAKERRQFYDQSGANGSGGLAPRGGTVRSASRSGSQYSGRGQQQGQGGEGGSEFSFGLR